VRTSLLLLLVLLVPSVFAIRDFQLFVVSPVDWSPVAGANVTLTDRITGVSYSAVTDSAGRIYFTELPEGRYWLRVVGVSYGEPVAVTVTHSMFMFSVGTDVLSVGYVSAHNIIWVDAAPFSVVSIGPYSTIADSRGRATFVNIPSGVYTLSTSAGTRTIRTPLYSASYGSDLQKKVRVYPVLMGLCSVLMLLCDRPR